MKTNFLINSQWALAMAAVIAAGCASEKTEIAAEAKATPEVKAAAAAAPVEYKDYKSAFDAIGRLRNKDKAAAADAADQAVKFAKTPDEKANALFRKGDIYWHRNLNPLQEKFAREAMAVEGISPRLWAGVFTDIMRKYYSGKGKDGLATAKKLLDEGLAKKDFLTPFEIVSITTTFAGLEFDQFEVESAEKRVAALERIKGVNMTDIVRSRASLASRKGDYPAAIAQWKRILSGEVPGNRYQAAEATLKLLQGDNRQKDVLAFLDSVENDKEVSCHHKECWIAENRIAACLALKDLAGAEAALKKLYETPVAANQKKYAEELLAKAQPLDFKLAMAKEDFVRAERLVRESKNVSLAGDLAGRFAARGKYAKAVEFYEMWWPKQSGWGWQSANGLKTAVIAYWRAGKKAELVKLLSETLPAIPRVEAKWKTGAAIAAECFRKGTLAKADAEKLLAGLEPQLIRDAVPCAAGLLIEVGFYEEPKMLNEIREKHFVQHPRNIAPCRYVPNAPTDAGSWFTSGLVKPENRNICDRKFGKEAAERLITDVNVIRGGKESGEGAAEQTVDSWFYVCYDEQGVHLLFEHSDPKIEEVIRGKTRPTDYEMYLAIGEGEQVYQFGVNPLKREFDYCPDWNSPHKRFRRLKDYANFSTRPTPYGFATAMNISWDLAYHVMPENGTEWPFEMIHWSRSGGVTWGGTDIWQVSNWGHWKFEGMTPEVKAKIHRVLMYKALARFQSEKNIAVGGVIGHWKDEELGDPEFYEKALKPLVEKLDAYAKEAEGEPADATVEKLFKEAVPAWYDFKYYASELRTKYLAERYTE